MILTKLSLDDLQRTLEVCLRFLELAFTHKHTSQAHQNRANIRVIRAQASFCNLQSSVSYLQGLLTIA